MPRRIAALAVVLAALSAPAAAAEAHRPTIRQARTVIARTTQGHIDQCARHKAAIACHVHQDLYTPGGHLIGRIDFTRTVRWNGSELAVGGRPHLRG